MAYKIIFWIFILSVLVYTIDFVYEWLRDRSLMKRSKNIMIETVDLSKVPIWMADYYINERIRTNIESRKNPINGL